MAERPYGTGTQEPVVVHEERPVPPAPPGPPVRTSGLAIASLVTGITCWFIIPFLGAIAAVITGAFGLREIRDSRGTVTGRGMAIAGIVLGGIQLVAILAVVLAVAFGLLFAAGTR